MKNSRKMRGLLVMLIAFAFCFLAEPVKAGCKTLVLRRIVVFHQCFCVVTDNFPWHAIEKPER